MTEHSLGPKERMIMVSTGTGRLLTVKSLAEADTLLEGKIPDGDVHWQVAADGTVLTDLPPCYVVTDYGGRRGYITRSRREVALLLSGRPFPSME